MKATTHSHSKLIADVFLPEGSNYSYVNRRGNEVTVQGDQVIMTHHVHGHYCYEHVDESGTSALVDRVLGMWTVVTIALGRAWSKVPRLTPKKYTAQDGVRTDWKATLPPRSVLASSATLAVIALGLNLAMWLQPQRVTPTVYTDPLPISATTVSQDRGVLSEQNSDQSSGQLGTDELIWNGQSISSAAAPRTSRPVSPSASPVANNSSQTSSPVVSPAPTTDPITPTPEVVVPPSPEPQPPAPEEPAPVDPLPPIETPIDPEAVVNLAP